MRAILSDLYHQLSTAQAYIPKAPYNCKSFSYNKDKKKRGINQVLYIGWSCRNNHAKQ